MPALCTVRERSLSKDVFIVRPAFENESVRGTSYHKRGCGTALGAVDKSSRDVSGEHVWSVSLPALFELAEPTLN